MQRGFPIFRCRPKGDSEVEESSGFLEDAVPDMPRDVGLDCCKDRGLPTDGAMLVLRTDSGINRDRRDGSSAFS